MNISNCKATVGLNARVTPMNQAASGTLQVGENYEAASLSTATAIHSFEAVLVGSGSDLVVDVSDMDGTGSTAWTAGVAQVTTATAVGTITTAGNATVTVTAAGMTGSPKAITVAVALNDAPATWAGKVRTALAADAAVAAMFTVGGTGADITLTAKPTKSYTVNGAAVNVYAANDATLNIALADGTSVGITEAASSADTTAGVATAGVYAPQLDQTDVFGDGLALTEVTAFLVKNSADSAGGVTVTQGTQIADCAVAAGGSLMASNAGVSSAASADLLIEPVSSAKVVVTVAGK